jgi:hypothetical protein
MAFMSELSLNDYVILALQTEYLGLKKLTRSHDLEAVLVTIQLSLLHIQNSSRATAVLLGEVSLGRVAIMQYAPGWEEILEPLLASKTCCKCIVALLWKRHVY